MAWGLLAMRVVFGGALVLHGMQRIGAPTTWMNAFGPSAPPAPLQFLAFFAEFGGGLALLFGLLTPLAALGVMFEMGVALLMVHAAHPWVAGPEKASKEGALGYFVFALLMLLAPANYRSMRCCSGANEQPRRAKRASNLACLWARVRNRALQRHIAHQELR